MFCENISGIGIAWSMAAIYHEANGNQFNVPVGSLGFSVTIFCIEVMKKFQSI